MASAVVALCRRSSRAVTKLLRVTSGGGGSGERVTSIIMGDDGTASECWRSKASVMYAHGECNVASSTRTPVQRKEYKSTLAQSVGSGIGDAGADMSETSALPAKPKPKPFMIVADELDVVSRNIIDGIKTQVPSLSSAAEYFFQLGSEGKRLRPTVLLLFAKAIHQSHSVPLRTTTTTYNTNSDNYSSNNSNSDSHVNISNDTTATEDELRAAEDLSLSIRVRQRKIAEITEMIHVASLLHDDVLDMASTRRGKQSLNAVMGGKMSILAGDFLLARASVTLASLKNTDVIEVVSKVIEDLVTGEVMQLSATPAQLLSFDFYSQKTYCKTASLFANSLKAVAMLANLSDAKACLAYEYGRHLGLAFQYVDDVLDFTGDEKGMGKQRLADLRCGTATAPVLFAAEVYPALNTMIQRRFSEDGDVERAYNCVMESTGIQRTLDLAKSHAEQAIHAINSLGESDCKEECKAREALKQLAEMSISRHK